MRHFVPCVSAKEGAGLWDCVESPSGVLILVGYHELVAVNLHLCVVPMFIVE